MPDAAAPKMGLNLLGSRVKDTSTKIADPTPTSKDPPSPPHLPSFPCLQAPARTLAGSAPSRNIHITDQGVLENVWGASILEAETS